MSSESSARPRRANGQGTVYQVKSGRAAGNWRCALTLPDGTRRTFFAPTRKEVEAKLRDYKRSASKPAKVKPPRRRNGQGTVYQVRSGRSTGKWRCAVTLEDGKRRTFLGASREEVEAKLLDFQHAKVHNTPLPPSRQQTVASYVNDWLEDQRAYLRPSTWDGYSVNVRHHILPSLGRIRLADLAPADIRRLHRESAARGLGARSVRYVHLTLNRALKQAETDGMLARNVASLAKPPGAPKVRISPFTPTEAKRFLEAVRGDELESLYVVTLGLGLRRGEVLGLRWSDVSWSERTVRIAGQLQRIKGQGLVWVAPKTDASIAVLDAPEFVIDALVRQRDRQTFLPHGPSDYVFAVANGTPLDPDTVTHRFPEFLKEHGFRHQRFHDLRHATASLLLAQGVQLWKVSKILRHGGIAITSDTYGYLYRESSRAAADAMNALMDQARG